MSKHKTFNKDDKEKDGEVARLKRHIRHLEKENHKLKSELRTYEAAFKKNVVFLKERTKELSLEELLKGAEAELSLREIKDEKVQKFEDLEKKWRCFECDNGLLKLIVIPHDGGSKYFRRCSNPKCGHRTDLKVYTEEVEGLK